MRGLLLIGGLATRLLPLSAHIAKSLLPVLDRELIHYQISQLARAGIGEIVLAAGKHVEQLRDFAEGYSGIELVICEEPEPRGTAGAIANARELLEGERIVVLNADILSNIDVSKLLETHERGGRVATLVGYKVDDPGRFGLFQLRHSGDPLAGEEDERSRFADTPQPAADDTEITGFIEKPEGWMGEGPHYINAGVYVLEPAVLAAIPDGRAVSIERETFPQLLQRFGSFTHFAHDGLWEDIGTFEGYFRANFGLLARRFALGPDALWGERNDSAIFKDLIYLHKSVKLGQGVDLFHRVALMQGCEIGAGCHLRDSILLPGVKLGEGCRLREVIIAPGVEIPAGSEISRRVIVDGEEPAPFILSAVDATPGQA